MLRRVRSIGKLAREVEPIYLREDLPMRVTARRLGAGWGDVSPLVGFTVVSHAAGSRKGGASRAL